MKGHDLENQSSKWQLCPRRKALLGLAPCTLTQRRPSCFKTLRLAEKREISKVSLSKISGQDLCLKFFQGYMESIDLGTFSWGKAAMNLME